MNLKRIFGRVSDSVNIKDINAILKDLDDIAQSHDVQFSSKGNGLKIRIMLNGESADIPLSNQSLESFAIDLSNSLYNIDMLLYQYVDETDEQDEYFGEKDESRMYDKIYKCIREMQEYLFGYISENQRKLCYYEP